MKTFFDRDVWDTFVREGEVVELRVIRATGRARETYLRNTTLFGYFNSHETFCRNLNAAMCLRSEGIYFTLQVIRPEILARAFNRLKVADKKEWSVSDDHVLVYRWIPVDIDPVRISGISSSDSELKKASGVLARTRDYCLRQLGFPQPVSAMSGNGYHLLFQLPDIPVNTAEMHNGFMKNFLNYLADKFDTDHVKIDRSVFNPSRIWKVYGTKATKGDELPGSPHIEARPHRQSVILDLPEQLKTVERKVLGQAYLLSEAHEKATAPAPTQRTNGGGNGGGMVDLSQYLTDHGIPFKVKIGSKGMFFCLDRCLFNSDHAGNESSIFQAYSGALQYQCFHNGCQDKTWKDARMIISGDESLAKYISRG